MREETSVHIAPTGWSDSYPVWLVHTDSEGVKRVAPPCVFIETKEGESQAPSLSLSHGAAQELMNRLWSLGLRPRDGAGTLAHVDAMRAHIEDLRRVAFSRLEASGPDSSLNLDLTPARLVRAEAGPAR